MTPTVAILVRSDVGGGAEAVAREWSTYLAGVGAGGQVVTYDDSDGDVKRLMSGGRGPRIIRLARAAAREIGDDVDVVVGVLTYSNLVLLLAVLVFRAPWRVVITEHNLASVLLRQEGSAGRIKLLLARCLYLRAAAAVGVSHAVSADLRGCFRLAPARIHTVQNPIPRVPLGDRVQNRVDPERLSIVGVGRLSPQKRFDLFLQVVAVIRRRGVDVRCSILGEGPMRDDLIRQSQRSRVAATFPGWLSPWTVHAEDYDVLLLTSGIEGFGNVVVEGGDVGLPAVVSAASLGSSEALIPGVTGFVSRTDDPEALADAVLQARQLGRVVPPPAWRDRFEPSVSGAAIFEVCRNALSVTT